MTAATDFPKLNALIQARYGASLDQLATQRTGNFQLDSVIHAYQRGVGGDDVPDPASYLYTLERFAENLNAAEGEALARKLSNVNHPSEFLDTVGEASLAEHYRARGQLIAVEQPLGVTTKNVDVFARIAGNEYWVDVLSVGWTTPEIPAPQTVVERDWDNATADELSDALPDSSSTWANPGVVAEKCRAAAERKYTDKFADAAAGPRAGDRLVVALCLLKRDELSIFAPFMEAPPPAWFQSRPGLAAVVIFTMRKSELSNMLLPVRLAEWHAPSPAVQLLAP